LLEQQHLLHPCRSYQEPFFAHESVFSKSPVFDVLCKSQFCEGVSKLIDLPEDDPNMLNLLLEFLYTGSFDEPKDIEGVLVAFQELYVLADKYQLFGLKTSVVRMVTKHMKDIGGISSCQFFETMHKIYSRVLNSDVPIRAYMGKFGLLRLATLDEEGQDRLGELLSTGGQFATEVLHGKATETERLRAELKHRDMVIEELNGLLDGIRGKHNRCHGASNCTWVRGI
jgi:hypothetical protein